jgi:hypothetical protein
VASDICGMLFMSLSSNKINRRCHMYHFDTETRILSSNFLKKREKGISIGLLSRGGRWELSCDWWSSPHGHGSQQSNCTSKQTRCRPVRVPGSIMETVRFCFVRDLEGGAARKYGRAMCMRLAGCPVRGIQTRRHAATNSARLS